MHNYGEFPVYINFVGNQHILYRVELNIMHAIFLSCKLLTPIDDSLVGGVGDQVRRVSLFMIVYHVNL